MNFPNLFDLTITMGFELSKILMGAARKGIVTSTHYFIFKRPEVVCAGQPSEPHGMPQFNSSRLVLEDCQLQLEDIIRTTIVFILFIDQVGSLIRSICNSRNRSSRAMAAAAAAEFAIAAACARKT